MRRARWLANWRRDSGKPVIYHCISRVVDRRFVLGLEEKEKFRSLMRIYERFSGCRVLSYCLMDNHFHLLLEITPAPAQGLGDDELLARLSAIYNETTVAEVAKELAYARAQENPSHRAAIHQRYTYRMHSLAEFMKGLLQRYTQWHNRVHQRTGRLWEDRFKSLIVQDGTAARAIAAYIDLNPVRAGIVSDPADYRWSSYGEAISGNPKGSGKTARAGLVRAWGAHHGQAADSRAWTEKKIASNYRHMLMGANAAQRRDVEIKSPEIPYAEVLRKRIRYFNDGVIIGTRSFVNEAFHTARDRFGARRKDGARKMRGVDANTARELWSVRDLRADK